MPGQRVPVMPIGSCGEARPRHLAEGDEHPAPNGGFAVKSQKTEVTGMGVPESEQQCGDDKYGRDDSVSGEAESLFRRRLWLAHNVPPKATRDLMPGLIAAVSGTAGPGISTPWG